MLKGFLQINLILLFPVVCRMVWEKFAIYWDVEMRMVPVTAEKITLDPKEVISMCDENTICVVPFKGLLLPDWTIT